MAGKGGEEDGMETEETQPQARPGVGEQLRGAREAMGRSCADLAEELRLTEDQIRALEDEDFSYLPGEAYVRGYLRNFAASVGLSPEAVIETYERQVRGGPEEGHAGDGSPLIPEPEKPLIEHPWRVVWISLALVAVVSGITVWMLGQEKEGIPPVAQQGQPQGKGSGGAPEGEPAASAAPSEEQGSEVASPKGDAGQEEKTAQGEEPQAPGGDAAAEPDATATTAPEAGSEAEPGSVGEGETPSSSEPKGEAGPPTAAVPTVPPAPGPEPIKEKAEEAKAAGERQVLRIRTWADAWLEVADDRGNLLLQRLVPADRDLRLHGKAPFQVKAGNAAGVQLYFEGKPLAPLGDPGEVVRVNVDADSETIPESEVSRPPGLSSGEGEGGEEDPTQGPDRPSGPENGGD